MSDGGDRMHEPGVCAVLATPAPERTVKAGLSLPPPAPQPAADAGFSGVRGEGALPLLPLLPLGSGLDDGLPLCGGESGSGVLAALLRGGSSAARICAARARGRGAGTRALGPRPRGPRPCRGLEAGLVIWPPTF
jgi:hypothetical protein